MKAPRDFAPRLISGGPEATIDGSNREFLHASAAVPVGRNLSQTSFAGGGQHGVGRVQAGIRESGRGEPLAAVDDLPGSALDAVVLARYVWLAASRYDEYRRNTVCVCMA
jgi:hypothetical protein